MTRTYTVIYERGEDGGWDAYAPDLPGLGIVGDTLEAIPIAGTTLAARASVAA